MKTLNLKMMSKQLLFALVLFAAVMSAGSANAQCSISPAGAAALCTGGSVVLTADAGTSYLWSNGETTQSITSTTGGTYNATIDGCPTNSVMVVAAAVSNSNANLCNGTSTLAASGPSVSVTGNYYIGSDFDESYVNVGPYNNVTGLSFGGSGYVHAHSGTVNFGVDLYNPSTDTWTTVYSNSTGSQFGFTGLTFTFPEISQVSQMRLTSGPWQGYSFHGWWYTDLTFTQQAGTFSYLWNTGATTQSISVNTPGTYSVAINGCAEVSTTVTNNVPGNPAVFGNNVWNVYLWNSGGFQPTANTWNANYVGYFTASELNFNTYNYWENYGNPDVAPGYAGCAVDAENHSWSAKRQGFDCGQYTINIIGHDDAAQLWINGVKVWEDLGCCNGAANVWSGILNSSSQVEFRATEGGGGSHGQIEFVNAAAGISGVTTFCPGYSSTLTAAAGASSYLWSTGETTQSITVNTAATFSVTTTLGEACTVTASVTTVVQPVAAPTVSADWGTTICDLANNYGLQYSVTNYNTAYTYTWSPGVDVWYQYGYVYAMGNYSVTATDALGCSATSALPMTASPGDPTVFGSNMWTVYAYTDLFGYGSWLPEYYAGYYTESGLSFDTRDRWADWASPSYASGYQGCNVYEDYHSWSAKRQGFPAGTYVIDIPAHDDQYELYINGVMVSGHNVCCDSHSAVWTGALNGASTVEYRVGELWGPSYGAITFTLINPLVITGVISPATYHGYNVSCSGRSNGAATVSASGGTTPYTYSWSNGQTNATATGLAAGAYTVVVTDAAGAAASGTVTLTAPSTITVNASSSNPLIFYGYALDQTAPITVSATGGTGILNYSWSMSRGLNCNVVNSAGDEQLSGGWNVSCGCSTANCTTPTGTYSGISFSAKLTSDANFSVVVTDANGCNATGTVHIDAIDARCFAGNSSNPKVQVCHHTGSPSNPYVTLCVSQDAVAEMLALGDCVGSCSSYANPMTCSGYRAEATEEVMMSESKLVAYPNPFTGITTIAFSVPKDGNTVIRVFDAMGRQVSVLFDGTAKAGVLNKVEFDGETHPAGIYFYSIVSEGMNEMKRMELVK